MSTRVRAANEPPSVAQVMWPFFWFFVMHGLLGPVMVVCSLLACGLPCPPGMCPGNLGALMVGSAVGSFVGAVWIGGMQR